MGTGCVWAWMCRVRGEAAVRWLVSETDGQFSVRSMGRSPIRQLDALLINQIAAGEVVERPASVVRELLDNAIDAGSRHIRVELEHGGIELVRITDDGDGIVPEDLPLALSPHATSKIRRSTDLDAIATMGFRGEALASIASVSRLTIRSTPREDADAGSSIACAGDRLGAVKPAPGPVGTSIEVRNLFFNTPARRKFLRTASTEQQHCLDAVKNAALARPGIGFTVVTVGSGIGADRVLLDVPPKQNPRDRVIAVLGAELAGELIDVDADAFDDSRGVAIWGLVGMPEIARANNKSQYVFLNGRPIRDKTVQHALREAYRGLIEPGKYPTCVLMLEMDPRTVDVNVHPAKTEVRFRDQSMVHTAVLRCVRDALRGADLTPGVVGGGSVVGGGGQGAAGLGGVGVGSGVGGGGGGGQRQTGDSFSQGAIDEVDRAEKLVSFLRSYGQTEQGRLVEGDGGGDVGGAASASLGDGAAGGVVDGVVDGVVEHGGAGDVVGVGGVGERSGAVVPLAAGGGRVVGRDDGGAVFGVPRPAGRLLQIHNSFVVTQDERGIVIIDQHALHERVMFEALLARVTESPLESQRLLVPEVLPVEADVVDRIDAWSGLFSRLGIEAEPIGPTRIGVHAFPTFLLDKGIEPGRFMAELFDRASSEGFVPSAEQTLHEVLDMMACKAAVKAGDRLTEPELHELLKYRELVERSSNCPHGRPTSIRLSIEELYRRFGRI